MKFGWIFAKTIAKKLCHKDERPTVNCWSKRFHNISWCKFKNTTWKWLISQCLFSLTPYLLCAGDAPGADRREENMLIACWLDSNSRVNTRKAPTTVADDAFPSCQRRHTNSVNIILLQWLLMNCINMWVFFIIILMPQKTLHHGKLWTSSSWM